MINDEKNDIREFINCREKAPAAAFEGTYEPSFFSLFFIFRNVR